MTFDTTKIRCSALGSLFTGPQSKEDKIAGNLSKTAKTYLNKAYVEALWGKRRDITTKHMDKGILAEPDAIMMLSILDDEFYDKNMERKEDDFICGHADIVTETEIMDIKCSWDAETFIPNLTESVNKDYLYQLQGYMRLWNKPTARIRYCLVSAPETIIQDELKKLLFRMDVATELNPEYIKAAQDLQFQLTFDEIPIEHRVIDIIIPRDEQIIEQIPSKVEKAREYLRELHEKHMKLSKTYQLCEK